jgi:hypothetical protein
MWSRKSSDWEAELGTLRRETAKHEKASRDYAVTGSKILELAPNDHNLFSADFARTGAPGRSCPADSRLVSIPQSLLLQRLHRIDPAGTNRRDDTRAKAGDEHHQ